MKWTQDGPNSNVFPTENKAYHILWTLAVSHTETNPSIFSFINIGVWASGQHPVPIKIKLLQKQFRVNHLSGIQDSGHLHWDALWQTLGKVFVRMVGSQGLESCLQNVLPTLHIGMLELFLNHQNWAMWLGKWMNINCMFMSLVKHNGWS